MREKITLTPYMRALLLDEICRRMNIISYCHSILDISLEQSIQNTFTGDCPFCSGHQSFVINKSTGKYFCINCRANEDFLALLVKKEGRDLNSTLQVLSGYLEKSEKQRPAYAGGAV
jgi:Fe2+ or Zn2+ uptake regulation protein